MSTISANVTKKELDAISEYANTCGETMSNLIWKCVISESVFRMYYGDAKDYNFEIQTPYGVSGERKQNCIRDIQ
ncbi:MAG: hypothetical protein K5790_05875 [Nitrosopumilus sp.]|uniref:hypothetical protein n=1 Tax=Nitrosopumilus sp. TaxID=2024843 RepID=UPI00247CA9A4|nr:hypothetical protein [Nitrosopumilus sp.]MCV0392809.1 hypothetical protein [Nitrosopumilus sp.]